MTKSEKALHEAVQELLKSGFERSGTTLKQTIRVATAKSPAFGKSGGELVTLGGRLRFNKPDTNICVTIGKRTFYMYEKVGSDVKGLATLNTSEIDKIKKLLKTMA